MPKLKTHKNAAKRFEFTGTGKMLRTKQMGSHLRRKNHIGRRPCSARSFPFPPRT